MGDRVSRGNELKNYHLINFGYSFQQFFNGTLSLNINNVFDKEYQPEEGYNAMGANASVSYSTTF